MDEPIRLRRPDDTVDTLHVIEGATQILRVGEQGIKVVNGEIVEQWGEGPFTFHDAGNGMFRAILKNES